MKVLSVMVVDDMPTNLSLMRALIERLGHSCYSVSKGEDAIELIDQGKVFDIIFIDINMPGMSGEELLSLLKKRGERAKCVAITGDSYYKTPLFDDILYKPFNLQKLKEFLGSL